MSIRSRLDALEHRAPGAGERPCPGCGLWPWERLPYQWRGLPNCRTCGGLSMAAIVEDFFAERDRPASG